jgi:hypothetical protein
MDDVKANDAETHWQTSNDGNINNNNKQHKTDPLTVVVLFVVVG